MVKRNLKPLLGLLIVLAGLPFMQTSAAQDPAGCEGMSAYREAMITTGQVYVDTLEEDGILPGRDPLTYSSAEWEMLAENTAAWQKALKSIEPPAWAVDWHQTQIELAGLQEQLGIAAAGSGVVATLPFEESFSALQASADLGADEATGQCTTFLVFEIEWETLGAGISSDLGAESSNVAAQMPGDVATYDYECCQHSEDQVEYTESPPVGGVHHPVWQTCGFYDVPVGNEHAVHSLEHGVVWVTYLPTLPVNQLEQLRTLAASDDYLLVSPYIDQEAPIVATAWNNQQEILSADDPALEKFVEEFLQGPQTPEPGAICSGGTSETLE